MKETARKKHLLFDKRQDFLLTCFGAEIQSAKKHTKIDSRTTLELIYAKSCSKKHPIFEKRHSEEDQHLSSMILDRTRILSFFEQLYFFNVLLITL